jgi:hypothetical protein
VKGSEVFIPEGMGCGAPGENPLQMLLFQRELQARIGAPQKMHTILLAKREAGQRVSGLLIEVVLWIHKVSGLQVQPVQTV